MADIDDDDLLDALGVEVAPLKTSSRTPREERIIAGFEDILRFHQMHGRAPQHGEGRDIFERLYAVRLDQLRKLPEAQTLLAELDTPKLLQGHKIATVDAGRLVERADRLDFLNTSLPTHTDSFDVNYARSVRRSETLI